MDLSNENIIHVKKDGVQYIQFRRLLEYKDIITHAYSVGTDVNFRTAKKNNERLDKKDYDKAINDYKNLCSALNINYKNLIKSQQAHTDIVQIVNKKINKDEPDIKLPEPVDGLITDKKDLLLATTNADCILLFFFDPVKKVIANVHSGWKGTLQRISVKTIQKMVKTYNCNPKDIICCICPSIRKDHFKVRRDVEKLFREEFQDLGDSNLQQIIEETEKDVQWNIDTVLINKIILEREGLLPENIIDSGICSVCNSDLIHSYRAEGKNYGLSTAIIELK